MLFENRVVELAVEAVPDSGIWVVLLFSYLGSIYIIVPAVVAACLLDRRRIAVWPPAIIGAYGLFVTLKSLVSIPRPAAGPPVSPETIPSLLSPVYELAVTFSTGSFPSGHAVAAVVLWGLIVYDTRLVAFRIRLVVASVAVTLISFSRLALGVHYLGDILGGILLGVAFLFALLTLWERTRDPVALFILGGGVPAAGGLVTGRPSDAATLLAVLFVVLAWFRVVNGSWESDWSAPSEA